MVAGDYSAQVARQHSTPASDGPVRPDGTAYVVSRTEDQWQQQLNPLEYHVLRESGTEAPYTGEYTDTETTGVYSCRA